MSSPDFFLINNKVWKWGQRHIVILLLFLLHFSSIISVTMYSRRRSNIGFWQICRFVLAYKSHWSIAESGSNSFSTVLWSLTRKRLLNVPCCILVFSTVLWSLTRKRLLNVPCCILVFSTVFSRFIAENDFSHVAVVGEIVIVSLTNTRTLFRSFWLRASRDAYTSLGFNALCVAKKFFNSCHSLTAPSFSSW